MKYLTIDEYLEKFPLKPNPSEYLRGLAIVRKKTFPQELVRVGMLKWEDETACCWGGPYKGNYVFGKIEDYSLTCGELKSLAEIAEYWRTYFKYSTYCFQHGSLQKYFPYMDRQFSTFLQISSDGTHCGRSSLTHQELELFLSRAPKEEKDYREEKIKEELEGTITQYTLSIELPVRFYLCGNDDTSYSGYFPTREAAIKDWDYIIEAQPDIGWIQERYEFTN